MKIIPLVMLVVIASPAAALCKDIPVYPKDAQSLTPIPLHDLLVQAMPKEGAKRLDWDHMLDAPILWITDGIAQTDSVSERIGLARVRIGNSFSTVLKKRKNEPAWSVHLQTKAAAKFGVEVIEIEPGTHDSPCFGTTFELCDFTPSQALGPLKNVSLCTKDSAGGRVSAYEVLAPGRKASVVLFFDNWGSGGASSYLEVRPFVSREKVCATITAP